MPATASHQVTLKQYFTDAFEVSAAMAALMGSVDGKTILEPSVGNGALLSVLNGKPSHIDAVDIDPAVLAFAKKRLSGLPVETHCADFIDLHMEDLLCSSRPSIHTLYDAVISNPPFGLFFTKEYRVQLKNKFPGLYVRESYGLFFILSIMRLKAGGKYVFLLPDTFLTSKNHASLRRFMCSSAAPSQIIRFPSKRFESVNFAYGNLCIVSGTREPVTESTRISWIDAFEADYTLLDQPNESRAEFSGGEWQAHVEAGWRRGMTQQHPGNTAWKALGEIALCKTGIYTGDNQQFIGYDPARVTKRLNGHAIKWQKDVHLARLTDIEKKHGLSGDQKYVPLIRGGHRSFNDKTAWAIRWDAHAIHFYKNDKKARLQNSAFYFMPGIAVPMVTSKRLSASLMDNAVFDQGVVGIFPIDESARSAILLYLNSTTATNFRNDIVNGGANNSANYLKKIPVPGFSDQDKKEADRIVKLAHEKGKLHQEECDNFIRKFLTKQDTPLNQLADS